jgi:hypothetical protein
MEDIRYAIDRLKGDVARSRQGISPAEADVVARHIAAAEGALATRRRRPWWRSLRAGTARDRARDLCFVAQEELMLLLPDDDLRARIPELRAALKSALTVDDPRYDEFTRLLDRIGRPVSQDPDDDPEAGRIGPAGSQDPDDDAEANRVGRNGSPDHDDAPRVTDTRPPSPRSES